MKRLPLPSLPKSLTIPPEIDAELSPLERRTAFEYLRDLDRAAAVERACGSCRTAQARRLIELPWPAPLQLAVDHLLSQAAVAAGTSREFVISQLVSTYQRAALEMPVCDRKGEPTGEYRFDGSTAVRALELLGRNIRMFDHRVTHEVADPIRHLLERIAATRPTLDQRRATVIEDAEVIDRKEDAAPHQLPAPAQVPDPQGQGGAI